jgi:hypothetical protein
MRFVRLLPFTVVLAGCYTAPRPISSPAEYIRNKEPSQIWIDQAGGNTLVLETPRIMGDSLLGYTLSGREEHVVPLLQLKNDQVRVRQLDKVRTGLLAGGITLAVGGMVALTAGKGSGSVAEQPGCSIYKKTCTSMRAPPAASFRIPIRIGF